MLQESSTQTCTDICTKPGTAGYVGQFTNFSLKRRFMAPRPRYIVASLIQYQAADIIVTAGKKVQANAPRTTEPAKNYGMSVKKWLALDRHKVKCSDSERLTSSSDGFTNFL